jgi:hypothetical protein
MIHSLKFFYTVTFYKFPQMSYHTFISFCHNDKNLVALVSTKGLEETKEGEVYIPFGSSP